MDILVICTGNMCRSPLAAALLRRRLAEVGVPTTVSSAGLVREGDLVPPEALEVGLEHGLDLSGHRAHRFDAEDLHQVDLVIGMAREHVREVVVTRPSLWPRSFTLKELVRRAQSVGARPAKLDLEAWLDQVHQGRRTADLLGSDPVDDLDDPMGGNRARFEALALELDVLVGRLVGLAWPPWVRATSLEGPVSL